MHTMGSNTLEGIIIVSPSRTEEEVYFQVWKNFSQDEVGMSQGVRQAATGNQSASLTTAED